MYHKPYGRNPEDNSLVQPGSAQEAAEVFVQTAPAQNQVSQEPVVAESNNQDPQSVQENAVSPEKPVAEQTDIALVPQSFDATIEKPYREQIPIEPGDDTYFLPSALQKDIADRFSKSPNFTLGTDPQSVRWAKVLSDSETNRSYQDSLHSVFEKDDTLFTQGVEVNKQSYGPSYPKFRSSENELIKGNNAVLRMLSHLGMGSMFQVPLWHSGFWITFKPPTESELVELQRQMSSDKIQFGRYSYGRLHSNLVGYTVNRLVDFALSHVYDTSLKTTEISINQLKSYIVVQDIFPLLWGLMATVYPKGFQYSRSCTADPEKCHHVVTEKINLTRLLWVDRNALSTTQKAHMTQRQSQSMSKDSVLQYQQQFLQFKPTRFKLIEEQDKDVDIYFQTSTVENYVNATFEWIDAIVQTVEDVAELGETTQEEKEALIVTHGNASILRQAAHQVAKLEFATNTIEDHATINETLDALSSNPEIVRNFLKHLDEFNAQSTVAVVGIPSYTCPSCQKDQYERSLNEMFTNIIPLDVIQLFFDFITQRIEKISRR